MSMVLLAAALTGCGAQTKEAETSSAPKETTADTSASTGSTDGSIPKHKETLIIGTDADVNNLDVQDQSDQANNLILNTTHQTILSFTKEGEIVPGVATSWEYVDDTHIKLTL